MRTQLLRSGWFVLALWMASGTAAYAGVQIGLGLGDFWIASNQPQKGYVRVALVGQGPESSVPKRAPVNLALVLDRSGSMRGEKLARAQEAAILMIDRFDANDIVSLVAYDDEIEVLIPATKLTDKGRFQAAVRSLYARNRTALYGGVQAGAAELRKFLGMEYVNRIVLLSDGIANVGPSTPEDLAGLGAKLAKEGISVTTVGIGLDFNEDLMTKLAAKSDGNHLFAEQPADVFRAFSDESADMTAAVAKNLSITISLHPRVHPVRAMGREASWNGRTVYAGLNQLCSNQTKYVLLEVDIDPMPAGSFQVATAKVEYADLLSGSVVRKELTAALNVTDSPEMAKMGEDTSIMECVVAQVAAETNESAVKLRDSGDVQQSRQALEQNAQWLQQKAQQYNSPALDALGKTNSDQAAKITDSDRWKGLRKSMSKGQFDIKQQTGK